MTVETLSKPPSERELALRVVKSLAGFGPGEVAQLRRLDASTPHCPAFWRLRAMHLEAALPVDEPARSEAEGRWAVVVAAMAEARGLHQGNARLGAALAPVIDERRVLQLLRAHDVALADGARMIVHHLVSRAQPFDQSELARLILSDGRADEEPVRRAIYRDFFAALARE